MEVPRRISRERGQKTGYSRPVRCLILLALLSPLLAWSRPWQGIVPGASTKAEVTKKFGAPTKVSTANGRELLGYLKVIEGTVQAHFRIDPTKNLVERIDVFPAVTVKRAQVIATYGPECGFKVQGDCHLLRKQNSDAGTATYLLYAELGLAVFFQSDGETVQSLTFLPEKR